MPQVKYNARAIVPLSTRARMKLVWSICAVNVLPHPRESQIDSQGASRLLAVGVEGGVRCETCFPVADASSSSYQ
jgi:hypothetical protein